MVGWFFGKNGWPYKDSIEENYRQTTHITDYFRDCCIEIEAALID